MCWWLDNSQNIAFVFRFVLRIHFDHVYSLIHSHSQPENDCKKCAIAAAAASKHIYSKFARRSLTVCRSVCCTVAKKKKLLQAKYVSRVTHQRTNRKLVQEKKKKNDECEKAL